MGPRGPDSPQTRPPVLFTSPPWGPSNPDAGSSGPGSDATAGPNTCRDRGRLLPAKPGEPGAPTRGRTTRDERHDLPGAPSEMPCRFCTDLLLQPASHPHLPGTCCAPWRPCHRRCDPVHGAAPRGSKELMAPSPAPTLSFQPRHTACGISAPQPGTEPVPCRGCTESQLLHHQPPPPNCKQLSNGEPGLKSSSIQPQISNSK